MSRDHGRHRATAEPVEPVEPRAGRIAWHRFGLVLTPALLALALLGLGAATGAVPVALAVEGEQTLKVTAKRYSADMSATFPAFSLGPNGEKDTVVVLSMADLKVQGLCVSTRVDTPMGPYVLRITTPDSGAPVSAGDLTLAIQNFNGLGLKSSLIEANTQRQRQASRDSLANVEAGGAVPLALTDMRVDVNMTVRWLTANQLELSGLDVSGNLAQRECT